MPEEPKDSPEAAPQETPEEEDTADQDAETEQDEEQEQEGEQENTSGQVSPLDPDFLLMIFLALVTDILDFALELGTIVSLIIGGFFVAWMTWRTGQSMSAQELQRKHAAKQEERQAAKIAARRVLRRGILMFVAELIPLLNLIPFWSIFVFSALRAQPAAPQQQKNQGAESAPGSS